MAQPSPIPVPWQQRWREFRISYLPLLMFFGLIIAIGAMWSRYVHPSSIIGEVEVLRLNIVATAAGTVDSLPVSLLQPVTNGQLLAVVSTSDPQVLQAELQAVEADLRLLQARMAVDQLRSQDDQRRSRLDIMNERINLSLARVRLRQAEAEFDRVSRLFDASVVPQGLNLGGQNEAGRFDYGYDVAMRDRDALRAEVNERTRSLAQLETGFESSAANTNANPADLVAATTEAAVDRAVHAQQLRLEELMKPVVLRAPIGGFVSGLQCRPGERVMAGAPLLTISSTRNDRVVAWVRQPLSVRPKIGDQVTVRRVEMGRTSTTGTVIEVGGQMEPLSLSLQPPGGNGNRIEVGLPILVQLANPGDLIAGETVMIEAR